MSRALLGPWVGFAFIAPLVARGAEPSPEPSCPPGMVALSATACVDVYEAHLERLGHDGTVIGPHPPNAPVMSHLVRAKSERGVLPQAYISQAEAASACRAASKRLCTSAEWLAACKGPLGTTFPYGARRHAGACNDRGMEPIAVTLGRPASKETWGFDVMNDPRLHLVPGGVARTGRFDRCVSEVGAHDMVGNLHEWTADSGGTLRGGYYLDTEELGEGCDYTAVGHDTSYRDYSTGFRCCADLR